MSRLFDLAASATALLILSPVLALLALLVKVSSPGSVFYRSERVGLGGKLFMVYKFRSMCVGEGGPDITRAGDPRITAFGALLRRSKLDELPQLLNVLRGDMSLVGPRPEAARYVAMYNAEQRRILSARPGITSPASLRYRSEEAELAGPDWERVYIERIMPAKLRIDLDYLDHRTVASDFGVIMRTIVALIE